VLRLDRKAPNEICMLNLIMTSYRIPNLSSKKESNVTD